MNLNYKIKILKILIVGLTILSALKLEAQDVKFGYLAGFVLCNARVINKYEKYSDYRVFYPRYSFNLNGNITYRFSKNLGISIEPGFIQKGGIIRFGINHYMSSIKFRLDYIQIPLLINYKLADRFYISLGPEFAFMINNRDNLPSPATGFSNFEENTFEISGLIGLNYCLSNKIDLGLRYNHAFTFNSILTWTDGYGPPICQSQVYNQYFQIIIKLKIYQL